MREFKKVGADRGSGPPGKSQAIGFLINTGPDPMENHKATKPVFNVGLPSARRQNGFSLVGR